MNPNELNQKVAELLAKLTKEEKIALLSGKDDWNTVPIERLGIPSITMTDGPHGVRATYVASGRKEGQATCFPTGISMAASWNTELVEQVGQALGEETRGMGCDIILGPCINIVRHPLAGRNFETYSEDPYLAGCMAVAMIKGVQSRGVGTSVKHYALNNYEVERTRASSNVDERTLREIYLAHFEMAVKSARPWTVMCSYNRINGVYASQNGYLLNNILREEWGFEGAVISDWGASHSLFESVANGQDLEMPGPAKYYALLGEAVDNWQVEEAAIDHAAGRVLRLILLSGRMDGTLSIGAVNTPEHQALARQLAEEAITLLKNERGTLPIPESARKIAVIGLNAAEAVIQGGGSSHVDAYQRVSTLQGLKALRGKEVEVLFEQGCDSHHSPSDDEGIKHAVEVAKNVDLALVFVGYPEKYESEGWDRPNMNLTGRQDELVSAVAETNSNTVVVLNAGAPVSMPWLEKVPAVVLVYYPGQESGNAIANVLTGNVNPSGKLPVTFPKRLEDSPAFINQSHPGCREVNYGEGLFIGYRYFDHVDRQPLFPFGHGLSYTIFEYSGLKVSSKVKAGEPVQVELFVKNSGSAAGKEVVQLYVMDVQSSLPRPPKELKGFAKVELQPGESREVVFTLDDRALSYYDPHRKAWVAEPGEFRVLVGSSSRDIRLEASFIRE